MGISKKSRAGLVAAGAAGALVVAALAGTAVANAADSPSAPTQSQSATQTAPPQHTPEEALTGSTADSVKAAVEAKYPDATIDRMEKDSDGQSVYEAHITKADGTHATVMLDESFTITGENAFGPGGPGGHGGKGGPGMNHTPEEALTGSTADSVKAAVEAKYPDATIDRMEKDSDGQSVYEAHITKADGTHVTVMLDESFTITGENAFGPGGPGGHGGRGDRHGAPQSGMDGASNTGSTDSTNAA